MALTQPIEDLYPIHPQFVNHDIIHCTAKAVAGDYLSSGRALGMTTPYDIIQLHPELMAEHPAICAHYDRIGLSYTEQIIWNLNYAEFQNYTQYEASYFYFGPEQHQAARNENWFRVVDYINSKKHFVELARHLGMRVPETLCVQNPAQLETGRLTRFDYPCYPEAALSIAGEEDVYPCENVHELHHDLAYCGESTPFLVQQEVEASTFLNLQYRVTGSRLERLVVTEQILEGHVHQGNRFPTPHNAWFSVEPMAKWLFSKGMRGIFAFDVAVVKDACGIDYVPIECNPRFNSASYPTLIAKKLGIQGWQTRTLHTRYRHIADLPLQDLEYNPARQSGIVLVNWGTVSLGKLWVLIAGTSVQQQCLLEKLVQRL